MTEQERINEQFQRQLDSQDAKFEEINKNIDESFKMLLNQLHIYFIKTLLGIGIMAIVFGISIIAALK